MRLYLSSGLIICKFNISAELSHRPEELNFMKNTPPNLDRTLIVGTILLAWFTFLKWNGML